MTIFAVMCAGVYPVFHVGRVWFAYWLFPIPNQMGVWPNFRSPLFWDVFAVSTYATVSLLFWYVGLVPDLATMRDRAKSRVRQVVYGIFALGWRGSHRHWLHYEKAYLIFAGLSTPLVLSRPHDRLVRLRRLGHPRLAHHHLSRRTSWRAPSSAASPWW